MRYIVREKFFSFTGNANEIKDDTGAVHYTVEGRLFSPRSLMLIKDPQGNQVGSVRRKLISLSPTYEIAMTGHETGVCKRRLINNPLRSRWTITVPGQEAITLTGNWIGREFTFRRGEAQVAMSSRKFATITQAYGVDVSEGENDLLVLSAVLALEANSHRK